MKTKSYVYCDYHECKVKASCQRYMDNLDRKDVDHIDPVKYDDKKGRCSLYLEDDDSILQQLNIISNA